MSGKGTSPESRHLDNPHFPLRRFVKCGVCQTPLTGSSPKGLSKTYAYYSCRNRCPGISAPKAVNRSRESSINVAAIYARKSTDQNIADEARSVTRQIQQAKAYAQANGWKVDERFIFSDDGISGAEFDSRPGFMRLMASLGSKRQKPQFQFLIVSELSRLGREQLETGFAVKKISEAGIKIYSYLERREISVTSATDKFIMNAVNFAAEVEREKARQRAEDTSFAKARAGLVTGGRTYGYDNTGSKGRGVATVLYDCLTNALETLGRLCAVAQATMKATAPVLHGRALTGEAAAVPGVTSRRPRRVPLGGSHSATSRAVRAGVPQGHCRWIDLLTAGRQHSAARSQSMRCFPAHARQRCPMWPR